MEIMAEETLSDNRDRNAKIYKDQEVWVGTMLGGPLVTGYMAAENYKAFGDKTRARGALILAAAAMFALLGIVTFAPFIQRLPNMALPLVYTGIAFVLVRLYQGEKIAAHLRAGGLIHGWGRTIAVALLGGVLSAVFLIGGVFLVDSVRYVNVVTKNYGRTGNEISFDRTNLTEQEADRLASALEETNFFDDEGKWYVYARKTGTGGYALFISINPSVVNRPQDVEFFAGKRRELQERFPDHKIYFNLSVDDFENVVKRLE